MRARCNHIVECHAHKNAILLRISIFMSLIVGSVHSPLLAQENYLQNGDFAGDVAGWFIIGDEGETMDWDGSIGSPQPGSLRLTAINSFITGPTAVGECISAPAGSSWELRAVAREAPGSVQINCGLLLIVHTLPDCSDGIHGFTSGLNVAGTDWTPLSLQFSIPEGFGAIRAALSMGVANAAGGSCNFDSVRLLGPPSLDVPALDHTGLLVLVAALALAGVFFLRRLR